MSTHTKVEIEEICKALRILIVRPFKDRRGKEWLKMLKGKGFVHWWPMQEKK